MLYYVPFPYHLLISRLAKAILTMHQKSNVKLKYVLGCLTTMLRIQGYFTAVHWCTCACCVYGGGGDSALILIWKLSLEV